MMKCTCCKKDYEKRMMSIECPKCYTKGIEREKENQGLISIKEVIKEVKKLDKSRVWNGNDGLKELLNIISKGDFG